MGCTTSRLDNEDTVRRSKERRRLMKEAVYARHHLAAAHSDYLRSLRLTGSALYDFASGEPLSISDQTPAVLLRDPSSLSHRAPTPPSPPPPPPYFSPSPSPSPTIASSKLPHILSESSNPSPIPLPKPAPKYNFPFNSTYSSTPSQSSSVWNWENFYPPSPPGSDFFRKPKDDDRDEEYEETEREEVHCSEWDDHDHYSTSSCDTKSNAGDNDEEEDQGSKSDIGTRSNFGSSVYDDNASKSNLPPVGESYKPDKVESSFRWNAGTDEKFDMKMVVRHRDLAEIAAAIKEYFEKAASSGESVSIMLETDRAQLDRSFRQLKKTVYHSNSILSTLSSSWTSKPPLAIKYRLETGSLNEPGGPRSHCSTLEQLLQWEKKLYEEVKAREGANIEHEKKLSSLQNQEYRGEEETKLDKTKASINRLQSLIVVASQAVSATSSAIIHVRDTELTPQLVELCHGFMYMWKSMNQFHEVQNHIVQQVRGLVIRSAKGESTSDLHRLATQNLESTVSAWHSSFCRLIKYQRDYVRSLHGWLKLTRHIGNDITTDSKDPSLAVQVSSDLFAFLDEWKQALDHLPDPVASEAIKSFVNVVHAISLKQSEELKIKKRAETASKELEKKALALHTIERKFYHSYSMVGLGLPGSESDGGRVFDARDPLAEKKLELSGCRRRLDDEMSNHRKAVEVTRAMTLNNIQTGLPGMFQAMTGFSGLITKVLEGVCTRSYSIK